MRKDIILLVGTVLQQNYKFLKKKKKKSKRMKNDRRRQNLLNSEAYSKSCEAIFAKNSILDLGAKFTNGSPSVICGFRYRMIVLRFQ